jgi:hypothetical protein
MSKLDNAQQMADEGNDTYVKDILQNLQLQGFIYFKENQEGEQQRASSGQQASGQAKWLALYYNRWERLSE